MTDGAELYLLPSNISISRLLFAAVAMLVCVPVAGCRSQASGGDASRIRAEYDKGTGRLSRLDYDGNANGRPDTWAFMDGARIIRLEADENEDGRIDRWEYYAASSSGGRPIPERIERSTRRDGRVSRREFFEAGVLTRIEEDTDGDGAADKWESYSGGVLSMMALDTRRRGKPDRRLIYRADGALDRIEVDPDGSGRFRSVRP